MADPGNINREIEVKLAAASAGAARASLEQAGFRERAPRAFESNEVFDTPEDDLRLSRRLLRLREFAGDAIVTYKGPPEGGPHKSREEIETRVENAEAFRTMLQRLGYRLVFRYEKYRTAFDRPNEPGHAVLDETPIGVFLELEGPPDWIDRTALELGFTPADYITASYGSLWLAHRAKHNLTEPHMIFPH